MLRLRQFIDPYILLLLGTVLLATVLPPRGIWASVFAVATDIGIVLLFFLHGAKLSREAILQGAGHWRLHVAVLSATFLMFPLLGIGITAIPGLPLVVASGLLFLTLLPSTVQSSIAFTAIARGNVAAAVCSASFSNLLGIFLTPALVALLMGGAAQVSLESVETILLQLLLPFLVGHACRPLLSGFLKRHGQIISYVDRGSILLVIYSAFGAAVVGGLWDEVKGSEIALILLLSSLLLAVILAVTWFGGKALGFSREDSAVLLFCGSKKSLATGVPLAGVLFPAAQVGQILLPVMIFHQIQLIACALIAQHLGRIALARMADSPTAQEPGKLP